MMRNQSTLHSLAREVNRIFYATLSWIIRNTCALKEKNIVFTSTPDYSDNSRAFSDYLIANGYLGKYKIFWAVTNPKKCKKLYPKAKVTFVKDKGISRILNLKLFITAGWQFGTHGVPYQGSRLQGQKVIRLWHGCSYKDKDSRYKKKPLSKTAFDYALVSGPLFIKTKAYFWNCDESKIIPLGYPRYDWLKKESSDAIKLKKELLCDNEKLIIWMPTYRNNKSECVNDNDNITQFPIIASKNQWMQLDEFCKESRIVLIVKLHPYQKDYDIDWKSFSNIKQIDNKDFELNHTNLYSFLSLTDALITDYSSVGVDYMVVNKPIAFTLDDFELYRDGRGFVIPNVKDYMPGHHLYTFNDLTGFIKDVANNSDIYREQRAKLKDTLIHSSNNYCQEIADKLGF